ncbi:unnamed protein product [Didymodactylos carnosus]|uniref:Uncharacterized protein n=1 Tax=Didymodactylos carnosus TaxID=1234261 RepID=A0A814ALN3_9BILA|nr:unnamed protein product [Didymodactylos carnosus]CAF3695504.1 unnamed protein product [Didymodactylos carnosus]
MSATKAPCLPPDNLPLFSGTCISKPLYTAIFLISIILAGISFLMVIALFIILCWRKSSSTRRGVKRELAPSSVHDSSSVTSSSSTPRPQNPVPYTNGNISVITPLRQPQVPSSRLQPNYPIDKRESQKPFNYTNNELVSSSRQHDSSNAYSQQRYQNSYEHSSSDDIQSNYF